MQEVERLSQHFIFTVVALLNTASEISVTTCAALGVYTAPAGQRAKQPMKIAAGAAPEAIAEFIRQTGLQVLFDFDAVRNFNTREICGELDPGEALERMFEGSGLMFEFINERTIAVRPRPPLATPAARPAGPT